MPVHHRRAPLLFVAAILIAACGSTTKYVAPNAPAQLVAPSPATEPQSSVAPTGACIEACRRGKEFALLKKNRRPIYDYDCLAKCPGVAVVDGECEEHEKPPNGFCVEKFEKNEIAAAIGGAILVTLLIVGVAASIDK